MSRSHLSRRAVIAGGVSAALLGAGLAPAVGATSQTQPPDAEQGWVTSTMARMTVREKVGQLFVQNVYGSDATTPDARNLPLYGVATPADVVRNTTSAASSTSTGPTASRPAADLGPLQRAAARRPTRTPVAVPLQIATDQEQGVVTRIGPPATQFPGTWRWAPRAAPATPGPPPGSPAQDSGHGSQPGLRAGRRRQRQPANPVIGTRSFVPTRTSPPPSPARRSSGYQDDGGVSATAKHFPGHGDTATDSHTGIPLSAHPGGVGDGRRPTVPRRIAKGVD